MRFIKILLICLLLCACSSNTSLDDVLSDKSASNAMANNYATYIDYYCPSDIQELSSDKLSYVFGLNDSKIIMNINIAGIINNQYYQEYTLSDEGFFDDDKLVYSYNGSFFDKDGIETSFFYNLYQYDDVYLMHFVDKVVNFYAYCDYDEINLMTLKIFNMAKSVEVDTSTILTTFSSKDVIDYHKSSVNLFETVMPVSGRVEDLMSDSVSGN